MRQSTRYGSVHNTNLNPLGNILIVGQQHRQWLSLTILVAGSTGGPHLPEFPDGDLERLPQRLLRRRAEVLVLQGQLGRHEGAFGGQELLVLFTKAPGRVFGHLEGHCLVLVTEG